MIHILQDASDDDAPILAALTNVTDREIHQAIHDVAEACVEANVYGCDIDESQKRLRVVADQFGFGLDQAQASWHESEIVIGVLVQRGARIVEQVKIHNI